MSRLSEGVVGTNLNSVWVEGQVLTSISKLEYPDGRQSCQFRIRIPEGAEPNSESEFVIEPVPQVLNGMTPQLYKGQFVRVIGRLHQHRWTEPTGHTRDEIWIIGEWLERGTRLT